MAGPAFSSLYPPPLSHQLHKHHFLSTLLIFVQTLTDTHRFPQIFKISTDPHRTSQISQSSLSSQNLSIYNPITTHKPPLHKYSISTPLPLIYSHRPSQTLANPPDPHKRPLNTFTDLSKPTNPHLPINPHKFPLLQARLVIVAGPASYLSLPLLSLHQSHRHPISIPLSHKSPQILTNLIKSPTDPHRALLISKSSQIPQSSQIYLINLHQFLQSISLTTLSPHTLLYLVAGPACHSGRSRLQPSHPTSYHPAHFTSIPFQPHSPS